MPTLVRDSIQTSKPGLAFTAHWQTWTIAKGVLVKSSDNNSVYSAFNGSTLFNNGFADSGYGMEFDGNQSHISNSAGATITGHFAISFRGDGAVLDNAGSILGGQYAGVFLAGSSDHVMINNSGDIYGFTWGVKSQSEHEGAHINNSGLIAAEVAGIHVSGTVAGLTTFIKNSAAGTIEAAHWAILADCGAISLDNKGTVSGGEYGIRLKSPGANDVVINSGKIEGSVKLGPGNDKFTGTNGTSGAIFGETGKDKIVGGKGGDLISGGRGDDTLTGGPGSDRFRFDAALSAAANVDTITDFAHAVDKIELDNDIFTATNASGTLTASMFFSGAKAHDQSDRIIYNPVNGFLTYDSNGNVAGGAVQFAKLDANLAVTNADFLVVG